MREEKAKLLEKFQEATRLAEEVKKLKAELDSKSGKHCFLGIRDILVRIRILGSVPLTKGPGCGSGRTVWMRIRNTGTFSSFFKDKKS